MSDTGDRLSHGRCALHATRKRSQQPVALDVLASIRTTALVTLVAASFSSPILVKSDAFDQARDRLAGGGGPAQVETEQVVAGGVEFDMPASWGRLGASAAAGDDVGSDEQRIGTVVSGLCPGGGAGANCTDGAQLTFIAYSGEEGRSLPTLPKFREQLDAKLGKEFPGFAGGEVKLRPGSDGSVRYLDYAFTWHEGAATRYQRIAAYRHVDGGGVVAMLTGASSDEHAKAVDAFLASAREPVDPAA